ncbi:MAG TPA: 1-deoxy-D-xylulose-5-phosphate reductoisomerase [Candidatus Pelagibacter bacterium]|jgi:1-deoxy-D-xylulose-5-phosphate reductoisomerase|nr:1-deoxy-D-xylulose-5-phosphate reductoisomerase [Pelagibacteraceae bacterium]HJN84478.1 1-deoxy-D-xylulose-5-phosphate reductoisomerase [Candidatus Pelagibacter bacterium]|tara:strand:- start:16989 stop:18152 length:1164 start_codon:yes stop_codon:yes gene_type:complete
MKKKIAILGSTGSIGKSTIDILKKDKRNFDIVLLTTNNNYKELLKQSKEFKVRNLIINNYKHYLKIKKKFKKKNIKVFNNFESFKKKFKNKIDFTMSAISGLEGLKPTIDIIKFTKTIAIANKESIICAWNLIQKNLRKYKTEFIPVDSEHFSIWSLLNDNKKNDIEKIIITASGGPFLNLPILKFKKIKPKNAIKHPNWKMGNKISVDSATLMNKVFEVIEAQRIFKIDLNKFNILIHPKSYVHAIIKFSNGLTKILVHDTDMKIPIFNSIYYKNNTNLKSSELDFNILNNLNFSNVNLKKFPSVNILKIIPNRISLYETILVSANDQLVDLFLNNKISFQKITFFLNKILRRKIFLKYKNRSPKNYNEIIKLSNYVRLKTKLLCI